MEPVTHFLTGACIGRAGFNRRTAYATLAATLAAEAPDMDVFWMLKGPVVGLAHHRGITHTLIGAPGVALTITGLVWVLDRYLFSRRHSHQESQPARQPVRWPWVFSAALVAALGHLVLDWTNDYGIRPFYPFNGRWYSGDIVFIAEPLLWAILIGALILPALLGLIDSDVGARRKPFRGRAWAIAAMIGVVAVWCWRWTEQAEARNMVEAAQVTPTPMKRISVEPYPINPFRWHVLLETDTTWQVAEVDTRTGAVESDPRTSAIFKPQMTPAIAAARQTELGKVYMDWSQWPVVRDEGPLTIPGTTAPAVPASRQFTAVQFSDLRFAYPYLNFNVTGNSNQQLSELLAHSGITGWVYILDGKEDAGQFLDGREQK